MASGSQGGPADGRGHSPVLLKETVALLAPRPGGIYVDGTVGLGGHAEALLEAEPGITLVGIDCDEEALGHAATRLAPFGGPVHLVHGSYRDLAVHLRRLGIGAIDGFLLDLGLSSFQLDSPARGFSFRGRGPARHAHGSLSRQDGGRSREPRFRRGAGDAHPSLR